MTIDSGYWGNGTALDSGYWESDEDTNVLTNADHIRSMTDEELAALLSEVEYRRSIGGGGAIWFDDEGAMMWLKQPYKEGT